MTDQPSTTLATPPTRIPASEPAGSANPPAAKAAIPTSSTAVPDSTASSDSTRSEAPTELPAELAADLADAAEPPAGPTNLPEPPTAPPAETASPEADSSETPESAASPEAAPDQPAEPSETAAPPAQPLSRNQPIPPASEPMQYRAIGLVRGKYAPSEEQFTRGAILTDDGVTIDAVLLGRVMSLVKKHIDLAESHLWVVYPRTREKDLELHMQIVGVWEPDKLNRMGEEASATSEDLDQAEPDDEPAEAVEAAEADSEASEPATAAETTQPDPAEEPAEELIEEPATVAAAEPVAAEPATAEPATAEPAATEGSEAQPESDLDDCYFSVRGEVVFQAEEDQRLLVKIRRAPKPGETEGKAFKVALKGSLSGKALGYFWDMQVRREGSDLTVQEATQIGMVPPQKRKPGRRGPAGGGRPPRRGAGGPPRRVGQGGQAGPPRRRWDNREGGRESGREGGRESRPYRSERPSAPTPAAPKPPVAKPVKRQKEEPSS